MLRPISGIAWIPLALFIFGIGNALPVFIMTYAAFFPILLGTIAGVRGVDRRLIDAARTMGVPQRTIVTRVVVPAALPSLLVALRLGVASSWTAVVAAELIGAPSGLGYAVEWYRELLMTPQVMSFIAMIGVLGYLCDRGVRCAGAPAHAVGARRAASARSTHAIARDDGVNARVAAGAPRGCMLPLALLARAWQALRHRDRGNVRTPLPTEVVAAAIDTGRVRRPAAGDRAKPRRACSPDSPSPPRSRFRSGLRWARSAPSSATSIRWWRASGRSPRSRSCRSRSCGSAPARRPRC